jgi:hypothetical protein
MAFYPPVGSICIDIHMNAGISIQRPQFWPFVRHLSSFATKKYRSFVGAELLVRLCRSESYLNEVLAPIKEKIANVAGGGRA